MKRFLSVIREKVIPNLGNIIWDWKFNYDREREQPEEYFDLLEGALRAYKKEFSEDNEAVALIEAGLERIRELIAELGEDYSRSQPRWGGLTALGCPLPHQTATRSRTVSPNRLRWTNAGLPRILRVFSVSVLVSVGSSFPFATVRGAARSDTHENRASIDDFRCSAFPCATMQNGLVRIMSPLL
jgi:hypothetical protein